MPKIIDHEKRREEIVAATWRVIAREGLAGTTTRKIGKEANLTSSLLAHYFTEKDAILDYALSLLFDRAIHRVLECIGAHSGFEALRQALLVSLPFSKERRLEVEVQINFWGHQLGDTKRTAQQYKNYLRWSQLLRRLIDVAIQTGEIRSDVDVKTTTDVLVGLVDGISAQAALYPARFPAARQRAVIDAALAPLRVDAR